MTPEQFCEYYFSKLGIKELRKKRAEMKEWDNGKKGHFGHEVICWIDRRIEELS